MDSFKRISIIILTYNSQKTIKECLYSISHLDYPNSFVETIILDNGSTDETTHLIESSEFTYHSYPELNLSQLRNRGADLANGEIIAFIDSDCIVAKNWIRQVVKWFNDKNVGIVGNEYLLPDKPTQFESNWYSISNDGIKYNDLIPAGNMAIRKDYFQQLGGFDNGLLTGEDDYILEIFRHAGYLTVSDHKVHSQHLGNAKSLRHYFKKETWYGLGMLGTLHLSKFDKPLVATLLFFTTVFCFFVFLSLYLSLQNISFLILTGIALLFSFFLPLISAMDRVYRKKRHGNILYVTLIFIVFFSARLRSLYLLKLRNYNEKSRSIS